MVRHQSSGKYLKDYHKNICKQMISTFKGDKKFGIKSEDLQSLLEMWENDGLLSDGTCMSIREYSRTLIQPHIQKVIKKYYTLGEHNGNKSDSLVNRKSEELWDSFEDFLKDYMGNKYYNKI